MTKQEQIEEIAKVIRPILENRTDICFIPYLDKPIAEELLKHYQPKLPEDSVVLSREEYDTLKTENDKYVKNCIDYIATINKLENKVWEVEQQASKETAEKILFKFESVFAYYDNKDMFSKKAIFECLEEIVKSLGVEIKE